MQNTNRNRFIAYVDESGDEGFEFGAGSSTWFVVSAVLFAQERELSEVKLVDEVREAINGRRSQERHIPEKKPLHFRDLKHDARRFYASRVGAADLAALAVCVHKPSWSRERSGLYFHTVRELVARIAAYARLASRSESSVETVFSHRGNMTAQTLREHLHPFPQEIEADSIRTMSPGKRMGLQIADAVASSVYFAHEPNRFDQTEDAYLRAITSRIPEDGLVVLPQNTEEREKLPFPPPFR